MNINHNEIHLWYMHDEPITNAEILSNYENCLSVQELNKMNKFYLKKQQKQYLLTRVLVRSILSQYIKNTLPESWVFSENSYGKPFIFDKSLSTKIKFNLSHSKNIIVLAVVLDNEVGVDSEYTLKKFNYLDIAKTFFTESELLYLLNSSEKKQKSRFFDIWTLKEAFVKATGKGFTFPLNQFSIEFHSEKNINITFLKENNMESGRWQFWNINHNDTHKIAIAINNIYKFPEYNIIMREFIPSTLKN